MLWLGRAGAGAVLARLVGRGATAEGIMAWSWLRILGRRSGPWVRMGDRAGVVRRVLGAEETDETDENESEGDDSNE